MTYRRRDGWPFWLGVEIVGLLKRAGQGVRRGAECRWPYIRAGGEGGWRMVRMGLMRISVGEVAEV